jgi:hypothetical protein
MLGLTRYDTVVARPARPVGSLSGTGGGGERRSLCTSLACVDLVVPYVIDWT